MTLLHFFIIIYIDALVVLRYGPQLVYCEGVIMTAGEQLALKIQEARAKRPQKTGPVVMTVRQTMYDDGDNDLIVIHLGARTTNRAIKEVQKRVKSLKVVLNRHHLYITSRSWAEDRVPVLETLLNANSNALRPGGWSWELRERVRDKDSGIITRTQLFEAPPATERYFGQAKVEWQPVYH